MIVIDQERAVAVIRITGKPALDDIQNGIEKLLANPNHIDGMDEIWDFRDADMTAFKGHSLTSLSLFVGRNLDRLAKRTALVISRDVDYGIGRMWQTFAEQKAPQERHLFRNIDEAYNWLSS